MKRITYDVISENNINSAISQISKCMTEVSTNEDFDRVMDFLKNNNTVVQDSIIVEEIPPTIDELKNILQSTDYKITKCMEYQLINEKLPYNIKELHHLRQHLREQINELEKNQ